MESDPQVVIAVVQAVLSAGSPWAALGALLMGLLRLLRLPLVQSILVSINPRLGWESWPQWAKMALPFILALGASLISALLAGGSWAVALTGAILAGLSAVTLHVGTKAAGSAIDGASVKANPEYQPSVLRKAVSPILPVDEKRLKDKLMNTFLNG